MIRSILNLLSSRKRPALGRKSSVDNGWSGLTVEVLEGRALPSVGAVSAVLTNSLLANQSLVAPAAQQVPNLVGVQFHMNFGRAFDMLIQTENWNDYEKWYDITGTWKNDATGEVSNFTGRLQPSAQAGWTDINIYWLVPGTNVVEGSFSGSIVQNTSKYGAVAALPPSWHVQGEWIDLVHHDSDYVMGNGSAPLLFLA